MEQKLIEKMTGYKATDENMRCKKDFQFELGKWYEHKGSLIKCKSGFHFCDYPSGVWAYYNKPGTRVFRVEAENVLQEENQEPGATAKRVCARIRLVEEMQFTGNRNTGNRNTGNRNTGNRNTGDSNTGYGNTGDSNTGDSNIGNNNTGYENTGDRNTGNRNTGYENTGYENTGDSNTGYGNTGDRNTGNRNTGNRNTGDSNTGNNNTGYENTGDRNTGNRNTGYENTGYENTGDSNTGYGNATSYSSGFFCSDVQTVKCFDIDTGLTREQFLRLYPKSLVLAVALGGGAEINFELYKDLPGITPDKLKTLHNKHIEARKKAE